MEFLEFCIKIENNETNKESLRILQGIKSQFLEIFTRV